MENLFNISRIAATKSQANQLADEALSIIDRLGDPGYKKDPRFLAIMDMNEFYKGCCRESCWAT